MNTLSLNEWSVPAWNKTDSPTDSSKKLSGKKKALMEKKTAVAKDFLNSLQKVPSHYCRMRTEMVYLETWYYGYLNMKCTVLT